MTKLKYNDINTNLGNFPDNNGVFLPQKWKLAFFFISQIGKHYTNVPNIISSVLIKKQHMTKLEYNDINTNRGIFPDNNRVFSPQKLKFSIFVSFFKLGKQYTNVPNAIQMFKLKNSI